MTKRLWLIIPWAIFAILVIGWLSYWTIAASTAKGRLAQWAEAQRAAGAEAQYGDVRVRGFPVLMNLEITDIVYAPQGRRWSLATDQLDMHVNLLNPAHVTFEAAAPITVTHGEARSTLTADALLVSVRMQGASLARAGFEADALTLDDPAQEGVLRADKVVANVRPDPRDATSYQLALDATALTLARPVRSFETFGQSIEAARAAIVIERAASLLAPADPLAAWSGDGGQARFEALQLQWGPLTANGQGVASIDEARRLTGRLELNIPSPGAALAAFAQGPSLSDDARTAVRVLAAGYAISGDDFLADIDAQDGVLYVERLPVRQLAPVY